MSKTKKTDRPKSDKKQTIEILSEFDEWINGKLRHVLIYSDRKREETHNDEK